MENSLAKWVAAEGEVIRHRHRALLRVHGWASVSPQICVYILWGAIHRCFPFRNLRLFLLPFLMALGPISFVREIGRLF